MNEWKRRATNNSKNGKFHDRITKANWWCWPYSMLASGMETHLTYAPCLPADALICLTGCICCSLLSLFFLLLFVYMLLFAIVDVVGFALSVDRTKTRRIFFYFVFFDAVFAVGVVVVDFFWFERFRSFIHLYVCCCRNSCD